ncbi:hypothetical protein X801_06272 [Opisthorchis viverrini]|uniref:Myosin motor domain-containing protein n=1 Tax=Opisthorchis viverrini TaxID=6198 RepID=A0A1S8WTZ0_OPIVI|nr:hypothetical protein X801_06272 [Opisthorchis viverrini]
MTANSADYDMGDRDVKRFAVRLRYECEKIYTWLGENILVSLNPNKEIPELYGGQQRDAVFRSRNLRNLPHIYSLMEQCLRKMVENKANQSVIISGLSGSGKTEAAKHALHYLVQQSSRQRCYKSGYSD